ncbi:hypothetical protein THRCLA_21477 [Thraustotheca clavata]|uniref:Uncharacterized protein n=1 Tax=Thraustotheca clavata TaxID=74557 RepID=A0A1V9ZW26_9STRA|nr:hypothetical protein THRCLA_21477 [Thraustotheca clavata]
MSSSALFNGFNPINRFVYGAPFYNSNVVDILMDELIVDLKTFDARNFDNNVISDHTNHAITGLMIRIFMNWLTSLPKTMHSSVQEIPITTPPSKLHESLHCGSNNSTTTLSTDQVVIDKTSLVKEATPPSHDDLNTLDVSMMQFLLIALHQCATQAMVNLTHHSDEVTGVDTVNRINVSTPSQEHCGYLSIPCNSTAQPSQDLPSPLQQSAVQANIFTALQQHFKHPIANTNTKDISQDHGGSTIKTCAAQSRQFYNSTTFGSNQYTNNIQWTDTGGILSDTTIK